MKTALLIVIALLIASIIGVLYLVNVLRNSESNRLAENARTQIAIAEKELTIQTARDSVHLIQEERKIHDSVARVAVTGLKTRVAALKAKLNNEGDITFSILSPSVVTVRDSSGNVWQGTKQQFELWAVDCLTKDTIIVAQDSLISTMEASNYNQAKSFNSEIVQLNSQLVAEHDIGLLYMEQHLACEKVVNKERKGKKFWRATAGVLTGGIATLIILLTVK